MSDSIIITPQTFIASQKDGTFAAYAENLQLQRDDAIARLAAQDQQIATIRDERTAALKAKDDEKADAVAAVLEVEAEKVEEAVQDGQAALAKAKEASDAEIASLNEQIAALTKKVAQQAKDCAAQLAAQASGRIAFNPEPLEALYLGLAQEAANAAPDVTVPLNASQIAKGLFSAAVTSLATDPNRKALLRRAIPKMVGKSDAEQVAVLSLLAEQEVPDAESLLTIAHLPIEQRGAMLALALPTIQAAMEALPPNIRDGLIVQVMA